MSPAHLLFLPASASDQLIYGFYTDVFIIPNSLFHWIHAQYSLVPVFIVCCSNSHGRCNMSNLVQRILDSCISRSFIHSVWCYIFHWIDFLGWDESVDMNMAITSSSCRFKMCFSYCHWSYILILVIFFFIKSRLISLSHGRQQNRHISVSIHVLCCLKKWFQVQNRNV